MKKHFPLKGKSVTRHKCTSKMHFLPHSLGSIATINLNKRERIQM